MAEAPAPAPKAPANAPRGMASGSFDELIHINFFGIIYRGAAGT